MGDALAHAWGLPAFRPEGRALVTEGGVSGESVTLIKPQTYMNLSGYALDILFQRGDFEAARDLLVLVDDVALPMGTFRIRARGSAGGHNGLLSIEDALDSQEYGRLRIGIGPLPEDAEDQAEFVLAPWSEEESRVLAELLPTMMDAVECWLAEGIDTAMNRYNRRGTERD